MPEITLSPALEDYLECIYLIEQKKHAARAKDIGEALSVRGSSVTNALRHLSALGLINYAPYDIITLTEPGREMAGEIFARHTALRKFLITVLGVEPEEADQTACKLEHAISREVMNRFSKYADYLKNCPNGATLGADFAAYYEKSCTIKDCNACQKAEK